MAHVRIADIETAAREYGDAVKILRNLHDGMNDAITKARSVFINQIKDAASDAGEKHQMLMTLLTSAPELFKDTKTWTMHGVRLGYKKLPGKLEVLNPEATIKRMREDFQELAATAISVKETVVKKALSGQPADVLKKLGINVTCDTDAPFIKLTDDEVQKLIDAMIAQASQEAE